jgi:DNA-binding PadR family transcriptional regulator
MYFDILMLRVLADGPRHGYEIKKSVERILGGRSINNNVLYPALRRFEEQGAIEPVAAEAGPGRPPRNVYRLTDTGHDLLQAMIRDADPVLMADDNEFHTRVAFFADLDVEERLRIIGTRRAIVESSIAHLGAMRPEAAAGQPWGVQVTDFNLGQKRQELGWLDDLAVAAAEPAAASTSQ